LGEKIGQRLNADVEQ